MEKKIKSEKNVAILHNKVDQLEQENAELKAKVNFYEEQIRLARKKQFGRSSEKTDPNQLSFFNEPEKESSPKAEEPTMETITYKRRKQTGKRDADLENLPEETIEYRLTDDEKVCPSCQGDLHEMSTAKRREIKIIPAQAVVVNHVQYIYACRHCEKENIATPIIKAKAPKAPIPKSLASPSAIAFTMSQKYCEALPLYRQEKYFERLGVPFSRQNLANWMIISSQNWLKPVYEKMKEHLLTKDILHSDDTSLKVLHEDGREAKKKSYMWLYRTGRSETPIVLYEYQETRANVHPIRFLGDYKGYLHVDGFPGYKKLKEQGVILVGCFAHARRYFVEALEAAPKESRQDSYSAQGVDFCNKLFEIERRIQGFDEEKRSETRQKESREVLDAFLTWLEALQPKVLPKSLLGKAVEYCLNQWNDLLGFMKDSRLEISNNRAERSIKPFVIGRKNWLFSSTSKGANASAIIYSVIETAKENGLIPFEYLKHLFELLPNIDLSDQAALEALLPWSTAIPQHCKTPNKK